MSDFIPTYGFDSPGLFIHEYLTKAKVAPMYEISQSYREMRNTIGKHQPSHYSFYQNYLWRLLRLNYIQKMGNIPSLPTYNQTYVVVKDPRMKAELFPFVDYDFHRISVYSLWRSLLWKTHDYISIDDFWSSYIKDMSDKLNIMPMPPTSKFDKVLVKISNGREDRDKVWENVQKAYRMILIKKDEKWVGEYEISYPEPMDVIENSNEETYDLPEENTLMDDGMIEMEITPKYDHIMIKPNKNKTGYIINAYIDGKSVMRMTSGKNMYHFIRWALAIPDIMDNETELYTMYQTPEKITVSIDANNEITKLYMEKYGETRSLNRKTTIKKFLRLYSEPRDLKVHDMKSLKKYLDEYFMIHTSKSSVNIDEIPTSLTRDEFDALCRGFHNVQNKYYVMIDHDLRYIVNGR